MYKLVDAVNQQMPETVKPTEMLILTKFAELVVDPKKPFRRVGLERFRAMTHIADSKTLRNHLNTLHEKGFLVCCEDRKQKRLGDRPTLYELKLPEGFDEAIVKARHDKYYFGRPFKPEYFEDNAGFAKPADGLSPVMRGDESEKIPQRSEIIPYGSVKIPCGSVKTPPSQVSGNQVINIPDDDDVVRAVLQEAAKATGARPSAFNKCGITAANAEIVRETIRGFKTFMQVRPDYVKSPAGFLIDRIKAAIANSTAKGLFGELPKADDATVENKAKAEAVWKKVVTNLNLAAASKDLLWGVRGEFEGKFGKKFGNKTFDEAAVKGICEEVTGKDPDDRARELSWKINDFCNS